MRIRNFPAGKLLLPALTLAFLVLASAPAALAQAGRTVFVEGNCNDITPAVPVTAPPQGSRGNPRTAAGSCGDYDGDGTIGTAEDGDGDNVYGTINGALTGLGGANGRVLIVKSGTYSEQIAGSLTNGHVQIEAAEGVEANIDAVQPGDPNVNNTVTREQGIGLLLSGQPGTSFTLRNLTVRYWLIGMRVSGSVRLVVQKCRFDKNLNYGIEMLTSSRITMNDSQITHTGRRLGTVNPAPAADTAGIRFADTTGGFINNTVIADSVGAGVRNNSTLNVVLFQIVLADNVGGNIVMAPGNVECRDHTC